MKFVNKIRKMDDLEHIPIRTINRNCKLLGYRVELWKYRHKRGQLSDYRHRNKIILHKED